MGQKVHPYILRIGFGKIGSHVGFVIEGKIMLNFWMRI